MFIYQSIVVVAAITSILFAPGKPVKESEDVQVFNTETVEVFNTVAVEDEAEVDRVENPEVSANAILISNYLKDMGYNRVNRSAILGNLACESGVNFNPSILERSAGEVSSPFDESKDFGIGIAQWTFPTRKFGLREYAEMCGAQWDDIYAQLNYMQWEIVNGYCSVSPDVMNELFVDSADICDATDYFCSIYEKGLGAEARRQYALLFYEQLGDVQ